jgi:hypothetical protein
MTDTFIELTLDTFIDRFQPLPNPVTPNAPYDFGNAKGCLLETYGPDWEFLRTFDRHRIWTLIDNNAGDLFLLSGLRWVNRLGFIITENPWPANATIEVTLDAKAECSP